MILFYNKDLKIEKGTLLRARLVHLCFGYALSLYRILIHLKLQFNKVFATTVTIINECVSYPDRHPPSGCEKLVQNFLVCVVNRFTNIRYINPTFKIRYSWKTLRPYGGKKIHGF